MADSKVQEQLADVVGSQLLRILSDGTIVPTKDGVVTVDAPAAYFTAAVNWLKANGISKVVTPGSDLARLAEEIANARFQPSIVAPLDDEPDEALDGQERMAAE